MLNELPGTVTGSTQDLIKSNMRTIILLPPLTFVFCVSPTTRTVRHAEKNNLIHLLLPINCRLRMSDQTPVYMRLEMRFLPLSIQSENTCYWAQDLTRFPPKKESNSATWCFECAPWVIMTCCILRDQLFSCRLSDEVTQLVWPTGYSPYIIWLLKVIFVLTQAFKFSNTTLQ